jgi:hypothetical protein
MLVRNRTKSLGAVPNGDVDRRVAFAGLEAHGTRRPYVGLLFAVGGEVRAERLHQGILERDDFDQCQFDVRQFPARPSIPTDERDNSVR